MMKRLAFALLWAASLTRADNGIIIPSDRQTPDSNELALESMQVKVVIDNGHATVSLLEVFHNKTARVLEGTYALSLPGGAAISDFAVWDDVTRIPGVILERKRAGELYNQIRNEAFDPGLLESSEVSESVAPGEAKHSSEFGVKIVPVPAYGYKRIEAEYRQRVPVTQLQSAFVLPLKSSGAVPLTVAGLSISVEIRSDQAITDFSAAQKSLPLRITSRTPNLVHGEYAGSYIPLNADLSFQYTVANDKALHVAAYRNGSAGEPGYFDASTVLQSGRAGGDSAADTKTVIVLFDTSLSMQWEKLERSFQALEAILRSMKPAQLFNVIVFNSDAKAFAAKAEPATPEAIAQALDFVRASRLSGGTNLRNAFRSAFEHAATNRYVVLLSDGELTEGDIAPRRFFTWFDSAWNALGTEKRPHIYALALGDDANVRLMQRLAEHAGVFEQVGTIEPLDFKLSAFVRKIGLEPLEDVRLSAPPTARLVYRLGSDDFPGARASWVGEYTKAGTGQFTISAYSRGEETRESATVRLPQTDTQHSYLPATWAQARVDALLDKIDREGEDKPSIDEIIELSRKYHFVTPYTSFLAAPRALLRPRLIRPGDPLLRVRTDDSIVSVIAIFPFGLTKPMRFLPKEDIWQTRFIVPDDLADGAYSVRLMLRDREGHVFREAKAFVISSHPPIVQAHLDQARVHAGDRVIVRVQASQTTRTIVARLYGANPLALHWSETDKSNTGVLIIPPGLPPGRYSIHVTAEDIAHNTSHQELPLEILH